MIVVSIGLIKARLSNASKMVKDLMSGTIKPDKIIFYVSREPHLYDSGIQPWEVKKYCDICEFRWVENTGPPRRIVPVVQEFWNEPETKIIIFDDDRKPSKDTLQKLVMYSDVYPDQAISIAGNIHNYEDKILLQNQGVIFDHLAWYGSRKSIGIALGWAIKKPIEVDTLSPGVGMLVKPKFFGKDFLNWKTVYKGYGINQSDQAFISYSLKKNNIKKFVIQASYVAEYPQFPEKYYMTWNKEHPEVKLRKYYRVKQLEDWIIDKRDEEKITKEESTRYFNRWRNEYDSYSFDKHKSIYNKLEIAYPNQQHFSTKVVSDFLKNIKSLKVLEIGGWKGELASKILSENKDIVLWDNCEICSNAIEKNVCNDKRYKGIILKDFIWNLNIGSNYYNVCVLSHIVEHIKEREVKKLLEHIKDIDYIYIESPIKENRKEVSWVNYNGTHILECGWNDIRNMLPNHSETIINANTRTYKKINYEVSIAYFTKDYVKIRGEKWVRESFDSLKNQSDDIMVIDYSSTDNIEALAKEYGFRFFRIERTPNQYYHISKMTNKSIIEAKYDLYLGVTPDIVYHKDTTKLICEFYNKHDMNKECLIIQANKDNTAFRSPMMVHNRDFLLKARGLDERITFYGNEHSYMNNIQLNIFKLKPTYIYKPLYLLHRPHSRIYSGIGINDPKQVKCRQFSNQRIRELKTNFGEEVKNVVNSYW